MVGVCIPGTRREEARDDPDRAAGSGGHGPRAITRNVCARLGRGVIGRVIYTAGAMRAARPVKYPWSRGRSSSGPAVANWRQRRTTRSLPSGRRRRYRYPHGLECVGGRDGLPGERSRLAVRSHLPCSTVVGTPAQRRAPSPGPPGDSSGAGSAWSILVTRDVGSRRCGRGGRPGAHSGAASSPRVSGCGRALMSLCCSGFVRFPRSRCRGENHRHTIVDRRSTGRLCDGRSSVGCVISGQSRKEPTRGGGSGRCGVRVIPADGTNTRPYRCRRVCRSTRVRTGC